MVFVLAGIALGLLISVGPLSVLARPMDVATSAMVDATSHVLANVLSRLDFEVTGKTVQVLSALVPALVPGLVVVMLVAAAKGADNVRRLMMGALVTLVLLSFLVLPMGQAMVLAVIFLPLAVMVGFFENLLATLPLMAVATAMAARYVSLIWTGSSMASGQSVLLLASAVPGPSVDVWRVVVTIVALSPFVLAFKKVFS